MEDKEIKSRLVTIKGFDGDKIITDVKPTALQMRRLSTMLRPLNINAKKEK